MTFLGPPMPERGNASLCNKLTNQLYVFRRFIPLVLVIIYSFIGAFVFMNCELEEDQRKRDAYQFALERSRTDFLSTLRDARQVLGKWRLNMTDQEIIQFGARDFRDLHKVYESLTHHISATLYLVLSFYNTSITQTSDVTWEESLQASKNFILSMKGQMIERVIGELGIIVRNESELEAHSAEALAWFESHLTVREWERDNFGKSPWNIWGSLMYAGTVYTTIGYGHMAAATVRGRICTVFYALFGIPLFLTTLNYIGKALLTAFRTGWIKTMKFLHRMSKKQNHRKSSAFSRSLSSDIASLTMSEDDVESEDENYSFPVTLSLFLLMAWIFISAGLFCIWERTWSYWTAAYFFFISITTIGLGDIIPQEQRYMMMLFVLIVVGLALVSLCFNTIQAKIEALIERMVLEMEESYIRALMSQTAEVDLSGLGKPALPRTFSDLVFNIIKKRVKAVKTKDQQTKGDADGSATPKDFHIKEEDLDLQKKLIFSMMSDERIKSLEDRVQKIGSRRHVAVQTDLTPKKTSLWQKAKTLSKGSSPESQITLSKSKETDSPSSYHTALTHIVHEVPAISRLDPILLFCEEPTRHITDLRVPTTPEMRRVKKRNRPLSSDTVSAPTSRVSESPVALKHDNKSKPIVKSVFAITSPRLASSEGSSSLDFAGKTRPNSGEIEVINAQPVTDRLQVPSKTGHMQGSLARSEDFDFDEDSSPSTLTIDETSSKKLSQTSAQVRTAPLRHQSTARPLTVLPQRQTQQGSAKQPENHTVSITGNSHEPKSHPRIDPIQMDPEDSNIARRFSDVEL